MLEQSSQFHAWEIAMKKNELSSLATNTYVTQN